MALFHVLLIAGVVGGTIDEICESCGADSAFVQLQVSKQENSKSNESKYWHPTRAVDLIRSGEGKVAGMFPLPATVDWEFTSPGHGSPVIDDNLNVYVGSQEGKIFSFDQHGAKRWEANGTNQTCQSPVLFAGTLYIACQDGSALAMDMMTGNRLWQSKVSPALPFEQFTLGVTKDYIFMPAGVAIADPVGGPFPEGFSIGSPAVAMLRRSDGEVLWKFDLATKPVLDTSEQKPIPDRYEQELMPCMLSDSVIFAVLPAIIYRLRLKDGHVMWKTELGTPWHATGGVSCREDREVLVGLGEKDPGSGWGGHLEALDIDTGKHLWNVSLPSSVYTPIAVGQIQGHAGTAIIAAMGHIGVPSITTRNHSLWAVDHSTGKTIWSFQTPTMTVRGSAGSTLENICLPQAWSTPIISTDGTVYINWSYGGITYALRDANKDGVCDLNDPDEVSSFDFGIGNYGGPALAPGMLAVRTCRGPRVLKVPQP